MKTMKFYLVMLMAAVMTFSLSACGGDSNNDGGGSAPDYLGIWVTMDTQTRFGYTELKTDTWTNVEYHVSSSTAGLVRKSMSSGGLSVNGNQVRISGNAPFTTATYSVSGNTMTLSYSENGQGQRMTLNRLSSADAAAKIAAWEARYQASQSNNN